jgi:hypothetical protein
MIKNGNWYTTDLLKKISLSSVNGYVYIPAREYVEQNPQESDVEDFKQNGDKIELIIGGSVFVFRGEVANELWNALKPLEDKELLKG